MSSYSDDYVKHLKVLELLKNKGVKPPLNKNDNYQFNKIDDKSKEQNHNDLKTFLYCAKYCNIRNKDQLNYMIIMLNNRLRVLPCNVDKLVEELNKPQKKLSRQLLNQLNKELSFCFNLKNKINFIKKYGVIKLSMTFEEFGKRLEDQEAWIRIDCGWVDLQKCILLVDNINLNHLYYSGLEYLNTDKYGVYLLKDDIFNEIVSYDLGRKSTTFKFSKSPLNHVKKLYDPLGKYITIKNDKQTLIPTTKYNYDGLQRTKQRRSEASC